MRNGLNCVALLITLSFGGAQARCGEPSSKSFAAARAEFDVAKVEFQKSRDELQQAAPDDRRVKVQQYRAQVENLKLAAAAVEMAAMAEYRQQPNQNKQLVEWMVGYLKELISRDDYETAAEIAGLLIQQPFDLKPEVLGGVKAPEGNDQTVLEVRAGLAFFGANDFDRAQDYLQRADKGGTLLADALQLTIATPQGAVTAETLCVKPQDELDWAGKYKVRWANEQKRRQAEAAADDLPIVRLTTTKGNIMLQLLEDDAPNTTANFINLVESKFYDDCEFHDVISGLGAQAGRRSAAGAKPAFTIASETENPDHRVHFRGSVSMVTAEGLASSEFRIAFLANRKLDDDNTVFARVTDGFDVLAKLQRVNSAYPTPKNTVLDKIITATVLRNRSHPYIPKRD